ncbi:MAG: phage virion morphogenesis protein [Pseudomonadota bacterium]
MTGVSLTIETRGLHAQLNALQRLGRWEETELLGAVGAVAEGAARRRLDEEKAGPDGAPWAPWSDAYGARRKPNQSLLVRSGALRDSLHHVVEGNVVRVGSNLVYAAIHQFGGADAGKPELPARPYLGLSAEDEAEIEDVVADFLAEVMR